MYKLTIILATTLALFCAAPDADAQGSWFSEFKKRKPLVGQKAPQFVLKDTTGKRVALADFLGKKTVVLEFGAIT